MNIAEFALHAEFEGHSNMARMQQVPADVASFVYAHPTRKPMFEIAREVLEQYPDVTLREVLGVNRSRRVVRVRQHIWSEVRDQREDASLVLIARRFNRDHQTVIYGIRKHRERMRAAAE